MVFPRGQPRETIPCAGLVSSTSKSPETIPRKHRRQVTEVPFSVFREIRDAVHQRQLLPKLGNWIAQATFLPEHGKTKLTEGWQPSHTTWWAYEGVNRASLFSVVREEG